MASLHTSMDQEKLSADQEYDWTHYCKQNILILHQLVDTLSVSVQQGHERVTSAIEYEPGDAHSVVTSAINDSVWVVCRGNGGLSDKFSFGSLAVWPRGGVLVVSVVLQGPGYRRSLEV